MIILCIIIIITLIRKFHCFTNNSARVTVKLKTGNRLDPAWQQAHHFPRVKVQSSYGQDAVATVLDSDSLCGKVREKPELHWKWKRILCFTQTQRVTISSVYVQQLSCRRLFFIEMWEAPPAYSIRDSDPMTLSHSRFSCLSLRRLCWLWCTCLDAWIQTAWIVCGPQW